MNEKEIKCKKIWLREKKMKSKPTTTKQYHDSDS